MLTRKGVFEGDLGGGSASSAEGSSLSSSSSSDSGTDGGGAVSKFSRDFEGIGRWRELLRLRDEETDGLREDVRGGKVVAAIESCLDRCGSCDSFAFEARDSLNIFSKHRFAVSVISILDSSKTTLGNFDLTFCKNDDPTSWSHRGMSALQDTRQVAVRASSRAASISGSPFKLSISETSYKHKTPSKVVVAPESGSLGQRIFPWTKFTASRGVSTNCNRYNTPPRDTLLPATEDIGGRRRSKALRMKTDLPTPALPTTAKVNTGKSSLSVDYKSQFNCKMWSFICILTSILLFRESELVL